MAIRLYYFTGTGNCLAVARQMGRKLGADIRPIVSSFADLGPDIRHHEVGIVFPAYLAALHGVPLIVERFVQRLASNPPARVFAVCTCGGYELVNSVPTLRNLTRYARSQGIRISAEYSVRLPMNNLDYEHIPVPIETDTETIIADSAKQIDEVCARIEQKQQGRRHFGQQMITLALSPMYSALSKTCMRSLREIADEPEDSTLGFRELMPLTDRSIAVDDSCSGCGTCVKVCPVANIALEGGRPTWLHHCEMCFACDEWCPRGAIHHWGRPNGAKYHHPEIGVRDLSAQAAKGRVVAAFPSTRAEG
jgi:formate hydrogenlyase subunit 6/NADH:ubiquinone oxidoreductase subunit I